ncbi:MAG: PQQ-binding-like beta-propeller repeat protein [Tannerellaceae bacterium]|nr:PQQ-binding-like beta-propeller repeat protein [Tannerellaceae bacterium]
MKKVLITCLICTSLAITAQENIQWRNDCTGIYQESGLLKTWPADGPSMLWHYDGLGEGHSSVAIADGKLYVTGMTEGGQGQLYVFDTNGKLLNRKPYGKEWDKNYNGSRGTVTVNEGKAYIIAGMGDLVCMDANTLDIIWKKNILTDFKAENIEWGINEAPLIIGDKLIATPGGKQQNLVALNKNTGELIWSSSGEGDLSAYCSPLYIGDQQIPQIVTHTANHIIGIEAETGKKLWSYENKNKYAVHANTPVYSDGMLLCTSGYGKGSTMLRLTNGGREIEKVWEAPELDNRIGAMVKVGDYAYGSGDTNRYWFCVNWKTGEITYKERGLAMGNIIYADGLLYCYSDRGEMAIVKPDPTKFDIVSKYLITMGTDQHWAHPVIHKGVMYIRHGDTLMAYNIK